MVDKRAVRFVQVGGSSHRAEYPHAWEPPTHVLTPLYIGAPREVVRDNMYITDRKKAL